MSDWFADLLEQQVARGEVRRESLPDGRTNYVQTARGAERARDILRRTARDDAAMEHLHQRIQGE